VRQMRSREILLERVSSCGLEESQTCLPASDGKVNLCGDDPSDVVDGNPDRKPLYSAIGETCL
jgi:hypothetical protein